MSRRRLKLLLALASLDYGSWRVLYGGELTTAKCALKHGLVKSCEFSCGTGFQLSDAGRNALGKQFANKA